MAEHPPQIYSCFPLLLPLLKHFVSRSSQLCGLSSPGASPCHLSGGCGALGVGLAAAQLCAAEPSQAEDVPGLLSWGQVETASTAGPLTAGSISPLCSPACAPEGAALPWHGGREGLAHTMRSWGASQRPRLWRDLLVLLCARGCASCSSPTCWKRSGLCSAPTYARAPWAQPPEHPGEG